MVTWFFRGFKKKMYVNINVVNDTKKLYKENLAKTEVAKLQIWSIEFTNFILKYATPDWSYKRSWEKWAN